MTLNGNPAILAECGRRADDDAADVGVFVDGRQRPRVRVGRWCRDPGIG